MASDRRIIRRFPCWRFYDWFPSRINKIISTLRNLVAKRMRDSRYRERMGITVSAEVLRGNGRTFLVCESLDGACVFSCIEVSPRRAYSLAERVIEAGNGQVVVTIESCLRYRPR